MRKQLTEALNELARRYGRRRKRNQRLVAEIVRPSVKGKLGERITGRANPEDLPN